MNTKQQFDNSKKQVNNSDVVLFVADVFKEYEDIEKKLMVPELQRIRAPRVLDNGNLVCIHQNIGSKANLTVWDLRGARCIKNFDIFDRNNHQNTDPLALELFRNNAVTGHENGTLKIWDLASGKCIKTIEAHTESVKALLKLNTNKIVSAHDDGTLIVWDMFQQKRIKSIEGHKSRIIELAKLPDGTVVSGCYDGTLQLWNMVEGECIKTSKIDCTEDDTGLLKLAIPPNDTVLPLGTVVAGFTDRSLLVWNVIEGKCIQRLDPYDSDFRATIASYRAGFQVLTILPNGKLISGIASSGAAKTIKIWDMVEGKCINTLKVPSITTLIGLPNATVICGARSSYGSFLEILPRKLFNSSKDCAVIESKLLTDAVYEKSFLKSIDFSDVTLSDVHLPLIARTLAEAKNWQKVINMSPCNEEGFEPLATFIGNKKISFQLHSRSPNGDTILHGLVRIYNGNQNKAAIKKLMRECLSLGVDKLIRNKDGKIAAQLAWELGANSLGRLLQDNRPAFDIPQIVLDWCLEQGWDDVTVIDGSKTEIILTDEKMEIYKSTPPKTQILSVQNIGIAKGNMTQTTATITNTEQQITLKLDQTLAASNKTLMAVINSTEEANIERNQIAQSSSNENTFSSSDTRATSVQSLSRSVESQNWNTNVTVSANASFSFFDIGVGVSTSGTLGTESSSQQLEEKTDNHSTTHNTQSRSHNTKSSQSTNAKEYSKHKSESKRDEQEHQKQFSLSSGEQQLGSRSRSERQEYSVTFKEGYHFINSEKKTIWTDYKQIEMQYFLGGQVGIVRSSQKGIIYLPLYRIFKDHRLFLEQVYPDYCWKFKQKNELYCTIRGNYIEKNVVIEKANEEHPLYRVKRLIDELVVQQNQQRQELESPSLAWMVNVIVESNKINPYAGSIEVRCSPNTDTLFLKNALEQFVNFSTQESLTITELPQGFTLIKLLFDLPQAEIKIQPKSVSSPHTSRAGLIRANSGEFKIAFFNQTNGLAQKREAANLTCEVIIKASFSDKLQAIYVEVDNTVLQLRFDPLHLNQADKVQLNAIRLALSHFLNHIEDETLPEPKKLAVSGQLMFCLDFTTVNQETINNLCNKTNHRYLIMHFQDLYKNYLGQLKSVLPEELRGKKDSLYNALKSSLTSTDTANLDF
jgi:WD40 repeat protein